MQVCTDLHGEAFAGDMLLTGCAEGVATAREGDEGLDLRMLAYPSGLPEGNTSTLLGSRAMQIFLGNYGEDAVVVIDPSEVPHFALVKFPHRRVDFTLDQSQPQFAYVLNRGWHTAPAEHTLGGVRAERTGDAALFDGRALE